VQFCFISSSVGRRLVGYKANTTLLTPLKTVYRNKRSTFHVQIKAV